MSKVSLAGKGLLSRWEQIFGAPPQAGADASYLAFFAAFRAAAARALGSDSAATGPATPSAAADLGPVASAAAPGQPVSGLSFASSAGALLPSAAPAAAFAGALVSTRAGQPVAMLYSDPAAMSAPLLFNPVTRELLTGSPDRGDFGSGNDDQLVLGGASEEGFALDPTADFFEQIVLAGGSDYALTLADSNVAAGRGLTVTATALGAGHGVEFDGSAETDGRFLFYGGAGADGFAGGAGDDLVYGLGGGDMLAGGGGADRFAYTAASESTGAGFDTLLDFDFGADRIDLPTAVTGFADAIGTGTLSLASFDTDLAAALGTGLGAGQALLFTADAGDLAGKAFLVVDGNGEAGYQAGEDYVFLLAAPPADPIADAGIFV